MKILLLCAAGMSTSLLVEKMKEALREDEKDWHIEAKPIDQFEELLDESDVILLGPQMTFRKNELQEKAAEKGVPVDVIDSFAYGVGDGEVALQQARDLLSEK